MDIDEKPIREYYISNLETAFIEPGGTGYVKLLFTTTADHEVALRLPPEVFSMLEAKMQQINKALASQRPPQ